MQRTSDAPAERQESLPEPETAPVAVPPAGARRWRVAAFLGVCLVAVCVAAGYSVVAMRRHAAAPVRPAGTLAERDAILAEPHLYVVLGENQSLSDQSLAIVSLAHPDATRYAPGLDCERVYYAAGEGLCLTLGHNPSLGSAYIFGPDFSVRTKLPAAGIPSRARISADGRYGSMTFFVYGDTYATTGQFSTRTSLIDMHAGTVIADLEQFTVYRGSSVVQASDMNFWGVTFAADSNTFYATLATGGKTYLIKGDVAARSAQIITDNVECPSLSPDGTRIVFKKRISDGPPTLWRLTVLDLATLQETPLAETRDVDDQAEWLDNDHVLYTPVTPKRGIWEVPADGSGQPREIMTGASSPSVAQ